ncbi:cytochrome P450 81Q32 [Spinacia oleracea]|uniref:Cytochrome P450 81Q32 n=1 Tax=Spinacia oleracea TaxID=3562 RepID=A0A9R0J1R5_SPIOL|nr:cytochrome P450 81Q32-like [Spinacia oleracea]
MLTWVISLMFISLIVYKLLLSNTNKKRLPPSPPSLPIIGHLHMLKQPLHECFHNIATKYGEIILLKFGVRNVLLISSPNAVQECLVKNDTVFADRPNTLVGTLLHYNNTSIAFSPYNDHFRTLKRLLTQEVFSSTKAPLFSSIRVDECRILLRDLWSETEANTQKPMKISINKGVMECGLNIMTRITSGKRYYGKDVENIVIANVFRTLMKEGSVLSAADNPGDFLPMLKFLFRGLKKKMLAWMEKTDSFYQRILDERKKMDGSSTSTKAVIDVLISAQKQDPVFFTNEVIKGMLMVLILAGSDTTASTIEWALSLLLNHPEEMNKAQSEIDAVIGHDRLLNEEDISKLPHLQNIVNETLRLYPPTPLLLPHQSSDDSTICGYEVPRGTMLMVSLWTIHRDPKVWDEPEKFIPERFEVKDAELMYKLLPFGLGRRACPGTSMGKKAVCLVLGSLIHCFDFQRIGKEMVDMSQCNGLTMPKAIPLEALCKVRPCMANLLAKEFNL